MKHDFFRQEIHTGKLKEFDSKLLQFVNAFSTPYADIHMQDSIILKNIHLQTTDLNN